MYTYDTPAPAIIQTTCSNCGCAIEIPFDQVDQCDNCIYGVCVTGCVDSENDI